MKEQVQKIVAYIDLLAFSNFIRENRPDALDCFRNYNAIVDRKISDNKIHPVNSYSESLKELASNTSLNAIEHFLPFSDSVFIVSDNPNSLMYQLSSFLLQAYQMNANSYIEPFKPHNPLRKEIPSFSFDEKMNISVSQIEVNSFPTIFRGGMAYGEVIATSHQSIVNYEPIRRTNIAGKAVVDAVHLENSVKGPRIIFKKDVYDQLSQEVKDRMIRIVPEKAELYELLWPAMAYIPSNKENDIQHFYNLFKGAVNLWKGFNHETFSSQYFNFIEIIIAGTIRHFQSLNIEVTSQIEKAIKNQGLENKMEALISNSLQK